MTTLEEMAKAAYERSPDVVAIRDPQNACPWSELAFHRQHLWRERMVAALKVLRSPDMEMVREVAAGTGTVPALVDLSFTRMIDAVLEEKP